MKEFLEVFKTKTGIFGAIMVIAAILGVILGVWPLAAAVTMGGTGLSFIFLRDRMVKKDDITALDPLLDKFLGDSNSAFVQNVLIGLLVDKGYDQETAEAIIKDPNLSKSLLKLKLK